MSETVRSFDRKFGTNRKHERILDELWELKQQIDDPERKKAIEEKKQKLIANIARLKRFKEARAKAQRGAEQLQSRLNEYRAQEWDSAAEKQMKSLEVKDWKANPYKRPALLVEEVVEAVKKRTRVEVRIPAKEREDILIQVAKDLKKGRDYWKAESERQHTHIEKRDEIISILKESVDIEE